MHKFFVTLILTLTLVFSASVSTSMANQDCKTGDACIATMGNSASAGAPVDGMVCVWFTQDRPGKVMIVLYADAPVGDSHVGTQILFEKTRWHEARSKYCFGEHRLDGVVWMMICNDHEHATRGIPSLTRLREQGEIDVCSLSNGC